MKNKNKIAIKKLNSVYIPENYISNENNEELVVTLQANVISLGFIFNKDLYNTLSKLSKEHLTVVYNDILPVLKHLKGTNVRYNPMYPNFPQQVAEMDELELFINAICHYWTMGQWKPEYEELEREFKFESTKLQTLGIANDNDLKLVFKHIVSSNDSISDEDKEYVKWFMNHYGEKLEYPEYIPFKENMCVVASYRLKKNENIENMITNATDILRIATYLSDGDISLSTNTKFKSFSRSIRRILVSTLEKVINEEDISRHGNKWIKLAHSLHVGDYSNKVYNVIKKVRENQKIETVNGRIEKAINDKNIDVALITLSNHPGLFARRLDEVIRMCNYKKDVKNVLKHFSSVINKIPTRLVLQLMGHFNRRIKSIDKRVVFPKGNAQKIVLINGLESLDEKIVQNVVNSLSKELEKRFKKLPSLGNVYIDKALKKCPIPTQQRSASEGSFSLARGSRIPFPNDKNTLRFFIYWVGHDIDLSATFHYEYFSVGQHISYTNLKKFGCYHSGDITEAPNGASEFIDVDIEKLLDKGYRYVVMNVLVYWPSGRTFSEHEKCYAGWMTREHPNSNEIYDPKTVEYKMDLNNESNFVSPVVFDLKDREVIWADMGTNNPKVHIGGNNVESNKQGIELLLEGIVQNNSKVSLYDLFKIHAKTRGTLTINKDEADTIFSLDEGITPFNVNTINSEYVI